MKKPQIEPLLDLGTWIGRGQAFGMVANQSLAAQAECLRFLRDNASHESLNITWDQFCAKYVGLSRPQVDALIHNLDEFGATYFRLSEIVRISPAAYRQIAAAIEEDYIEIDGEKLAIAPVNAPRIRAGIHRMREALRKRAQAPPSPRPQLQEVRHRMESWVRDFEYAIDIPMDDFERRSLYYTLNHTISSLQRMVERVKP